MTGLGQLSTPEVMDTFDRICRAIGRRRKGFSIQQIGDAHALAKEFHQEEPDREKMAFLIRRLDLTGDLDVL